MKTYQLRRFFEDNWPVTQQYGERPDYYGPLGFKGHEGVDYGTPNGVDIFSPFDGVILQDYDIPNPRALAYGDYIVVWDPKQLCAVWFCHLKENFVSVGQIVKAGQFLGRTGASGNVTGPHCHVNFAETDQSANRINTDNGYHGFLNILKPGMVEWITAEPDEMPMPITDKTIIDLGEGPEELGAYKSRYNDIKRDLKECRSSQPITTNPVFTNLIAKILYKLALLAQKRNWNDETIPDS